MYIRKMYDVQLTLLLCSFILYLWLHSTVIRRVHFKPVYRSRKEKTVCMFMQGTNLLSYYLCNFVLYLTPFMSCDNCI